MSNDIPRTYVSGPSDPVNLADAPGTWVETEIAAPPSAVWAVVVDIDAPAEFSNEFNGADWVDGGPHLGAVFVGRNQHPVIGSWEVKSFVDVFEPERRFGWATIDVDNPGSRWCYELTPNGDGTRLRYSLQIGPGPSGITAAITAMPNKEPRILQRRLEEHHANMIATVEGIKARAEATR